MGYYTRYEISGRDADIVSEWIKSNRDISIDYLHGHDTMKWYDHDTDIIAAMQETGATEVDLRGDGEEQGDVWDKQYRSDAIDTKRIRVERFKFKLVRDEKPS